MKITVKAGEISITVEHDAQAPHPKDTWYGTNTLSFTSSIQDCIKEASSQIINIQKELYGGKKQDIVTEIESAASAKNNVC